MYGIHPKSAVIRSEPVSQLCVVVLATCPGNFPEGQGLNH